MIETLTTGLYSIIINTQIAYVSQKHGLNYKSADRKKVQMPYHQDPHYPTGPEERGEGGPCHRTSASSHQ